MFWECSLKRCAYYYTFLSFFCEFGVPTLVILLHTRQRNSFTLLWCLGVISKSLHMCETMKPFSKANILPPSHAQHTKRRYSYSTTDLREHISIRVNCFSHLFNYQNSFKNHLPGKNTLVDLSTV